MAERLTKQNIAEVAMEYCRYCLLYDRCPGGWWLEMEPGRVTMECENRKLKKDPV